MHYIGSALAPLFVMAAVAVGEPLLLLGAPLVGYGCAWYGHIRLEGNKPATFGHPVWSLASDYRMLFLWLRGRLEREFWRWQIR